MGTSSDASTGVHSDIHALFASATSFATPFWPLRPFSPICPLTSSIIACSVSLASPGSPTSAV